METTEAIREFIRTTFLFGSSNHFSDDDSFMENGIIDSTGVLELVSFVEGRFDIDVKDDELVPENFDSTSKLAEYVARKQAG